MFHRRVAVHVMKALMMSIHLAQRAVSIMMTERRIIVIIRTGRMGRRQIRVRMVVSIHCNRCQLDRFLIIPRHKKKQSTRRDRDFLSYLRILNVGGFFLLPTSQSNSSISASHSRVELVCRSREWFDRSLMVCRANEADA